MMVARKMTRAMRGWLCGVALAHLLISPSLAAERARLDHVAALTVVFELLADWPESVPAPQFGLFAIYGPREELRASGDFRPDRPFVVTARPGDRLTFAVRIGDAPDTLIQTVSPGIALFTAVGRPATGNVTARIGLLDPAGEKVMAAFPPLERLVRVTIH